MNVKACLWYKKHTLSFKSNPQQDRMTFRVLWFLLINFHYYDLCLFTGLRPSPIHQLSFDLQIISSLVSYDLFPFEYALGSYNSPTNPFINTLRPRQNGRLFPDDIFKSIFFNENVQILIKISLTFAPKAPINNISALVQIMAWRRPGDKPLSEPMMVSLLTHICVTRPQWVKVEWPLPKSDDPFYIQLYIRVWWPFNIQLYIRDWWSLYIQLHIRVWWSMPAYKGLVSSN